jgi:hypothetical protein
MIHRLTILVINTGLITTIATILTLIFVPLGLSAHRTPAHIDCTGRRPTSYIHVRILQHPRLALVWKLGHGQSQLS